MLYLAKNLYVLKTVQKVQLELYKNHDNCA